MKSSLTLKRYMSIEVYAGSTEEYFSVRIDHTYCFPPLLRIMKFHGFEITEGKLSFPAQLHKVYSRGTVNIED